MTTYDKLDTINDSLNDIKTAIVAKGVTPSGNITTYASAIDNIVTESGVGIPREVSAQGVYGMPTTSFTFSLPSGTTDLGNYVLYYAFYVCTGLTSIDLSSLTTVGGSYALSYAFSSCTNLTSIDLSNLTTVSGSNALSNAFRGCTNLTSIDLSNLTIISSYQGFSSAFSGCTGLTSIDLSNLTIISSYQGFNNAFGSCTNLTSIDLSNLTTVSGSNALRYAFSGCTSLTTLSFPALTSTSFGSYTNQFNNMLYGVTGCTVHFPSNLQSVIGSWSDVTAGFGGTSTTVLFDLPATT